MSSSDIVDDMDDTYDASEDVSMEDAEENRLDSRAGSWQKSSTSLGYLLRPSIRSGRGSTTNKTSRGQSSPFSTTMGQASPGQPMMQETHNPNPPLMRNTSRPFPLSINTTLWGNSGKKSSLDEGSVPIGSDMDIDSPCDKQRSPSPPTPDHCPVLQFPAEPTSRMVSLAVDSPPPSPPTPDHCPVLQVPDEPMYTMQPKPVDSPPPSPPTPDHCPVLQLPAEPTSRMASLAVDSPPPSPPTPDHCPVLQVPDEPMYTMQPKPVDSPPPSPPTPDHCPVLQLPAEPTSRMASLAVDSPPPSPPTPEHCPVLRFPDEAVSTMQPNAVDSPPLEDEEPVEGYDQAYEDFLASDGAFRALDPLPSTRLAGNQVRKLIQQSAHRKGPGFPVVDHNHSLPSWSYYYHDCPSLSRSIPKSAHPMLEHINDVIGYLLQVAKPCHEDSDFLRISEAEANAQPNLLRQQLAKGGMTVITDVKTPLDGISFDPADPMLPLLAPFHMEVEAQNFFQMWETDIQHSRMPFGSIFALRDDPLSCLNLLEFGTHGESYRPHFISAIADDRRALRCNNAPFVTADQSKYPRWMLFAHALASTTVHQDSRGMATYSTVLEGRKYWLYYKFKIDPTAGARTRLAQCVADKDIYSMEYTERPPWVKWGAVDSFTEVCFNWKVWERESSTHEGSRCGEWFVIDLPKGDTLLQPSNIMHAVHTPVPSIVSGGHWISWESLPAVRNACRVEALKGGQITNDAHSAFESVLLCLAASLGRFEGEILQGLAPFNPPRNSVAALSRLIFHYSILYLPTDGSKQESWLKRLLEDPAHRGLRKRAQQTLQRYIHLRQLTIAGVSSVGGMLDRTRLDVRTAMFNADFVDDYSD